MTHLRFHAYQQRSGQPLERRYPTFHENGSRKPLVVTFAMSHPLNREPGFCQIRRNEPFLETTRWRRSGPESEAAHGRDCGGCPHYPRLPVLRAV